MSFKSHGVEVSEQPRTDIIKEVHIVFTQQHRMTTMNKANGSTNEGLIHLISKEGDVFEVTRSVGMISDLVKDTIEDDDEEDNSDESDNDDDNENGTGKIKSVPEIPIPNVTTAILGKVVEFCKYYKNVEAMTPIATPLPSSKLDEIVQSWYADYVRVEKDVLLDLVGAAHFMEIPPLLDLTCLGVSILIKGKSASELRELFNLSNELTAEEEEEIQKCNNLRI